MAGGKEEAFRLWRRAHLFPSNEDCKIEISDSIPITGRGQVATQSIKVRPLGELTLPTISSYLTFPNPRYLAFSRENVQENELIVAVPLEVIFYTDNVRKYSAWGQIVADAPEIDPVLFLALSVLFEKHNPASYWKPYLAMLPETYTSPLFWNESELHYLRGTVQELVRQNQLEALGQTFETIVAPLLSRYPTLLSSTVFTTENLKWALTTVWSRAFWMDDAETVPCIVPFADMFNHSLLHVLQNGVATCAYSAERQRFEVWNNAPEGYLPGQEVFITYGQKSNYELLADYGFILPKNPLIQVFLDLSAEIEATRAAGRNSDDSETILLQKQQILEQLQINIEALCLTPLTWPKLLITMLVYSLSPTELDACLDDAAKIEELEPSRVKSGRVAAEPMETSLLLPPLSFVSTATILAAHSRTIACLRKHASQLPQDKATAQMSSNIKMAIGYVDEERNFIQELIDLVERSKDGAECFSAAWCHDRYPELNLNPTLQ